MAFMGAPSVVVRIVPGFLKVMPDLQTHDNCQHATAALRRPANAACRNAKASTGASHRNRWTRLRDVRQRRHDERGASPVPSIRLCKRRLKPLSLRFAVCDSGPFSSHNVG
ncbi:hypothetical protein ACQR16_27170 [Bradyrhizobium oligotrophicum]|uniref:hypothetical protein n=1 Tax=Bradyrhizobium oligotrophicum TaxID=44255 RepID=UPI003EBFD734